MKMLPWGVGLACLLAVGGGVAVASLSYFSPDTSAPPEPAADESTSVTEVPSTANEAIYPFQIVFGGDFATGNGCAGHKSEGCDLYSASIDLSGGVDDVTRLTTMGAPDVFPSFSADGSTVYATHYRSKSSGDVTWSAVDGSGTGVLIQNAIGAAALPDGKSIVYTSTGAKISMADFVSPTEVSNERVVSADGNYHEPHASSINGLVVMHRLFGAGRGSNTSQPVLFNPMTGEITDLMPSNGSAHCFWDGEGSAVFCNNTEMFHGMFRVPIDGSWTEQSLAGVKAPNRQQMAMMDSDFAVCKGVSYAYATFCDAAHLIATLGCELETDGVVDNTMSKLALLDISVNPPTVIPLGKNLADSFGGPGIASHTVACRMK